MSFGETLRAARETKGMTCSEVAKKTRLLVQIVEEMEQEDFHRIAAPIYGRGFVRLYAQCVGLDPAPLVAEFMEIYEGHRAPIVRTKSVPTSAPTPGPEVAVEPPPPPPAAFAESLPPPPPPMPTFESDMPETVPVSEPVAEPVSVPDPEPEPTIPEPIASPESEPAPSLVEPDMSSKTEPLAVSSPEPIAVPEPEPISPEPFEAPDPQPVFASAEQPPADPPPAIRGLDLFEQAYANQHNASTETAQPARNLDDSPFLPPSYEEESGPSVGEKFREALSNVSQNILTTVQRIPRSAWRFSILGLSAVLVLAMIVFACVKLYQLTTPATPAQQVAETKEPTAVTESTTVASPTRNTEAKTKKPESQPVPTPSVKKMAAKTPARPAMPGSLRSTGQKIPSLYID